jgi:predicted CopG family antitoxin
MISKLKHIVVSEENFQNLKNLGRAGDSFNDVITQILKNNDTGRTKKTQPVSEPRCQLENSS